jgi:chitodextrinase
VHRSRSALVSTLALVALVLGAGPGGAATRSESAPKVSGPVAAYGFDEGSGGSVADASGNGNTGTVANTAWSAAGKYGGALSFNGSNSWVTVPDAPSLDLSSGMTLEAWVKPTALGSAWRTVILKEQPGQLVYALYANTDTLNPSAHANVSGDHWTRGTGTLPLNSWSFLSVTFDGTILRLFVDGNQVSEAGVYGAMASSSNPLRIGGNAIWSEWFQGLIDNVRIYNRALGQAELQTDMATPVGAPSPPPPPTDTQPPSTPGGLTAAPGQASLALTWQPASDNVGVSGYDVYLNGSRVGSVAGPSYTFSGLACGSSYTLGVVAYDAAGNRSGQAPLSASTSACPAAADTQPPSTPTGLAMTTATQTSVSVTWNAATDNVGVAGYGLYRNGALIGTAGSTSTTFSGLTCGTIYSLAVDAYDAAGKRSAQAPLTVATSACPAAVDTQPPSAPSGLVKTGATQTTISVKWNAATDDVGVAGYDLYRGATATGKTTQLSATFSKLTCGQSYTLNVDAYDAAGNRSPSVSLTTRAAACTTGDTQPPTSPGNVSVTGATNTSVSVGWSPSTDNVGVAGYGLYRGGASVGSTTSTAYTFGGLACGTTYTLAVDAYDAAGNRSSSVSLTGPTAACAPTDTQAPTSPGNVVVTGTTQNSVALGWSPSTDNVGVAGYGLYVGAPSVGSTASTSYTFGGLACGTMYTFAVDAYDAAGNRSAKTSTAKATDACPVTSATLFLSPTGSDSSSCTRAAPCQSFDRAYRVAQPGQTVELAGGTYSSQLINQDYTKTSMTDVFFRPAAGATVTVGDLNVYGAHLSFQDFTVNGDWSTFHSTDDVTFRNLTVHGGIFTSSSSNISVIGGSVGPMVNVKPQFGNWPSGTDNYNILVDGVWFHDITRTDPTVHVECLLVTGVIGFTLRNSRFSNCDVFDLSIGEMNGSDPPSNLLIENNFFGTSPDGYFSLDFNTNTTSLTNVTIRNNSATQEMYLGNAIPTITNMKVTANIAPLSPWSCDNRIAYSFNVFQGATCGSSDLNAPAGFMSPSNLDLHLVPGAAAINRGNPSNFPATDIDGRARPLGSAPDAGAVESG